MILLIALCYAELGTMFPLSGGVVRFPHLAFGSFASFTTGWITWVAVHDVAPIEVEGALQYATKYAPFTEARTGRRRDRAHADRLWATASAVVLMALFVVVNYFGVKWFARVNNALVWWKLAIILVVIAAFLVTAFHGENFTSHGLQARPAGTASSPRSRPPASCSPTSASGRASSWPARPTTRKRNMPIAVIGSVLLTARDLHPAAGRVHRRARRRRPARQGLVQPSTSPTTSARWPRSRRIARPGLAGGAALHRRDHLARPTPA